MTQTPADFTEDIDPDKPPPNNRHGARQLALQALYWNACLPGTSTEAMQELGERFSLRGEICTFAASLVKHVEDHLDELDGLIDSAATNWSRERIARIDGLILKLALAEMLYFDDIPLRASIDEAIELAKTFSTERSYAFINGILDAVARQQGLAL